MSGMGGLALIRSQKAAVHFWKTLTASDRLTLIATFLDAGISLEPILPRVDVKTQPGQENHLGMVIMNRIGQSADLLPTQTHVCMEGSQRLNGNGSKMIKIIMEGLRYSPLLIGNMRCKRFQLSCYYNGISQHIMIKISSILFIQDLKSCLRADH